MLYYGLLLAQEQARLIENSVQRVRESLHDTRALNRAGLAADYDVLRLEVELGNLEPNLFRAQNSVTQARRELGIELALENLDDVRVAGSLAQIDLDDFEANSPENREILGFSSWTTEPLTEDVVRAALDGQSDLRQLDLSERLRESELSLERVQYLPEIVLFGSYGILAQQNGNPAFFGESNERTSSSQAGIRITWPIFSGFSKDARIDQRRASLRQAEAMTQLARARADSEVETMDQMVEARARAGIRWWRRGRVPMPNAEQYSRRAAVSTSRAPNTERAWGASWSSPTPKWPFGRVSSTTHRPHTISWWHRPISIWPWAPCPWWIRDRLPVAVSNRGMRKIMTIHRRLTAGLLTLLLGALACGGDIEAGGRDAEAGGTSDAGVLVEGASRVINVETSTVKTRDFVERISLTGTVVASQDVTLSAQESGVIRRVVVDQGATVTAGQPLLEVDDAVLRSQVEEAMAQASLANETWERRKRLYEVDQVGSELAYLEARYGAEQASARLTTLQVRLGRTVIRAPIDGVLETRLVEVGAMVNIGTDVARIVSLDPVKVVAGVPERYARDVRVGASATTEFDVLDISSEGRISYVGATVNARNRTFLVELEMPNPDGLIKPEMVANVGLVRQTVEGAVVIPQEALVRVEDGYVVFVVEGNGSDAVVVTRAVEIGSSQRNEVVVEAGLTAGERLIVVGQQQVTAGDRVNVVGTR